MITKQKGTYDVYGLDAKKRKYVYDVIDAICILKHLYLKLVNYFIEV